MKTSSKMIELYEELHLTKDVVIQKELEKDIDLITKLVPKEVEMNKLTSDLQKMIFAKNNGAVISSEVLVNLEVKIKELKAQVDEGIEKVV